MSDVVLVLTREEELFLKACLVDKQESDLNRKEGEDPKTTHGADAIRSLDRNIRVNSTIQKKLMDPSGPRYYAPGPAFLIS